MHPSIVETWFWAAGLLGHALLLFVLIARHRVKPFPFFTAFIADNILKSISLFLVRHYGSSHTYLVTYVSLGFIDLLLQACVAFEIATHVFRPTGTWVPELRKVALVLLITGIVVAVGITCMPTPPERTIWKAALDRANLFSSALLCEVFLGMIGLSVNASIPWKTHVARICQGLGFYSLLGLITEAGHNVTGMVRTIAVSHELTLTRETTYLVCLTYWIIMLWREAPPPRALPEELLNKLFTLQRHVEYDLRKLRLLK